MPTLRRDRLAVGLPLLRRPGRRRPPHAHPGPHRGDRLRRGGRQRPPAVGASPRTTTARSTGATRRGRRPQPFDGRRPRRSSTPPASGPTTCAPSTRARDPDSHPPGQGHPHHRAVGQGAQRHRRRRSPCPRTSARSSWCRGATSPTSAPPTPTTTAPSTTRSAPPTTSPTCCGPSTTPSTGTITAADIIGTWAGLRPLVTRRRQRAHRRPVPPPPGARARRLGRRHRSPAASSPPTGRWPPTPSTRCVEHVLGDRALAAGRPAQPHPQAAPAGRRRATTAARGHGRPPASAPSRSSTWPTATAARRRALLAMIEADARRWPSRWSRASPTCGPRPSTPRATRWPARVDDVLSRRTRARLLGRDGVGRGRRRRRRPGRRRPRLGRRRAAGRQVDAYRAVGRPTSATAAGLPETAVPRRLIGRPAVPDGRRRPAADHASGRGPRRATHATGVVGHRPSRSTTVPVLDAALRRRSCAAVTTDAAERAEASRDWWPLAMTWALDGQVRHWPRPSPGPRPTSEVAAVLAICNEAGVPVTAAGGRSGVCGGVGPALRRRGARPVRPDRHPLGRRRPR